MHCEDIIESAPDCGVSRRTKLTKNIALDQKAAGQPSKGVTGGSSTNDAAVSTKASATSASATAKASATKTSSAAASATAAASGSADGSSISFPVQE